MIINISIRRAIKGYFNFTLPHPFAENIIRMARIMVTAVASISVNLFPNSETRLSPPKIFL